MNKNFVNIQNFEFIEFTSLDTDPLEELFNKLGFIPIARSKTLDLEVWRQGNIKLLINHVSKKDMVLETPPDILAEIFATVHGPSVCSFGINVECASTAFGNLVRHDRIPMAGSLGPSILSIGGIRIQLIDKRTWLNLYQYYRDFEICHKGVGLTEIDHITHNVEQGKMDYWANWYADTFGFEQIRYFDIKGKKTGLKSRAMKSPCGKIRIPINEPSDPDSQIQEYLDKHNGPGIQHIAFSTNNIYETVLQLRKNGIKFLDVPDSYYDKLNDRIPGHTEDIDLLKENKILLDGSTEGEVGLLLQIFTETVIGPLFFEIIQRKGNDGFGDGNFNALFRAIEEDQIERGVL